MKRYTKAMRAADFYKTLANYGFSFSEANQLRRIEMTLHRWHEKECGTSEGKNDAITVSIERDETGKPFERRQWMAANNQWRDFSFPVADKETGAKKRLARIMANHPNLWAYIQGDPRGCALYVGSKSDKFIDLNNLDSCYSRGFGVCI